MCDSYLDMKIIEPATCVLNFLPITRDFHDQHLLYFKDLQFVPVTKTWLKFIFKD